MEETKDYKLCKNGLPCDEHSFHVRIKDIAYYADVEDTFSFHKPGAPIYDDSKPLPIADHPKTHTCKGCGRGISIMEMEDWELNKCTHCKE